MKISHNGLAEVVSTFEVAGFDEIEAGTPLILDSNMIVPASEGDAIVGFAADRARNRKVAVQLGGYIRKEYSGTASYGRQYIKTGASGKVAFGSEADENTIPVNVIFIDSENSVAGFMM